MTQKVAPKLLLGSKNESRYPVVTVDGPSGAGKGTLCLRLARELNYQLLDSGALYRIVGLKAHQEGLIPDNTISDDNVNKDNFNQGSLNQDKLNEGGLHKDSLNESAIAALTNSLDIRFVGNADNGVSILVNGIEVGQHIRNEVVGAYASKVAALPEVREALLDLQKNMAKQGGLIADGRDMGTVVFPNADVKIYLTATAIARANRRVDQLRCANEFADYDHILATIQARDDRDENREVSPSRPAKDALVIDSSTMTADEVYQLVKSHCQSQGISFSQ